MEYICHRVNTREELSRVDPCYGVELDLRDDLSGRIYIEHEPFKDGESFDDYLDSYRHGMMILNVKSERIELTIREALKKRNISNYFFLDSSFPMIKLLSDMGERKIALRYSEYEGIETLKLMAGKVDWVWIDCFTYLPVTNVIYNEIRRLGYKMCLVSPELQGQPEKIQPFAQQILKEFIVFDAICTKSYNIQIWENLLRN